MATVHSSRTCLPKLCCSITVAGLLITGILITGAYPQQNLINFKHNQTDTITNDTNLASTGNITFATKKIHADKSIQITQSHRYSGSK